FRVMSPARELAELLVRKMFHQAARLRVFAEEMLANVRSGLHGILHELAVADLVHTLDEQAALVLGQEPVPVASPDDLDDVPAGASEGGLQLLDDLAVAADRAVQALQVAVNDEDQVVEPFPRGERQGAQRLGLIRFTIAQE